RELARIKDAGRALANRGDDLGERALQRLKDGDAAEAERLFAEELETETKAAAEHNAKAAQAAKNLAALAKPRDIVKAAKSYKRAAELAPEDVQNWIDYGEAVRDAGDSSAAMLAFQSALDRSTGTNNVLLGIKANYRLGDIAITRGNLASARQLYE